MQRPLVSRVLAFVLLLTFILSAGWLTSRFARAGSNWYVGPTGNDTHDCATPETSCATIQAAIIKAADGDTINVAAGTYNGNVVVNKNISLIGAGAASTIINGNDSGSELGTIQLTPGRDGVTIQGFHIIGIDSASPGLEKAAVYLQGAQTNIVIQDNIIEARGDAALMGEYNAANNGITIHNNEFTGKTFIGDEPATGDQFTVWNVARQAIVFGGGTGTTNTQNFTFTDNTIATIAAGTSAGNTLVTLDLVGTNVISGNTFSGKSSAHALRVRGNGAYNISPKNSFTGVYPLAIFRQGTVVNGNANYWGSANPNFSLLVSGAVTTETWYIDAAMTTLTSNLPVENVTQNSFYATIQAAINAANPNDEIHVAPGTYTENVNINKALKLRGRAGGDFSTPVAIAQTAAPGVWYVDRYRPGVFDSYNFNGEMVLRHGIRGVDVQASSFYNYQGRKLDTNLTGPVQSMTIDLWVDSSWLGAQRNAGIWSTGFDVVPSISAYPIVAWRSGGTDPEGIYAFDYINGGWLPLMIASPSDYDQWHTLSFVLTAGTGMEYFVDGKSRLLFEDPDTLNLNNLILNAYNFGSDYDVYWDNWWVESIAPATFESVVNGLVTITASNVEVTGFYLKNPGQTNAVLITGLPRPSYVTIANNRIQDVGSTALGSNVHAIYINSGPDNVTIANNSFSNLKSGTRSVSAVGVLDSLSSDPSNGLVVKNNTFTDIASTSRGAYGIIINNAAGAPDAQVKGNTFSGLSGAWTHAVGLEGPTLNAIVTGNVFSDLTAAGIDKAAVFFEKNPVGNTVTVADNLFNGPAFYGVAIHPNDLVGGSNGYNYVVDATKNWWGTACGPSSTGVDVGLQVEYSPWWGDPDGSFLVDGQYVTDLSIPDGASSELTNAILACAAPGSTVDFEASGIFDGGIVINTPGLTLNLNGGTVGAGSPAFTIEAEDVTIQGPGVLDGDGSTSPGILVNAGANNFTLKDVEVREWADGVEVAGNVTSFKLFDNWIHSNTDAGLQVNSGVTLGGVVSIQGNLFKVNGGNGIQHDGDGTLPATYNSWGDVGGPTATDGDGVSANVTFTPWTFAEVYLDVYPDNEAIQRNVNEGDAFDVALKVEAANLYGVSFRFSYDNTLLTFSGPPTFSAPWVEGSAACLPLGDLATNEIGYQCALIGGPQWNGGTVATFRFTANGSGLSGNGPWSALFDISHLEADTSAGALNGAKVFVNNAGFNDPSIQARDITDVNDGKIDITGLANFTGFVDLQGRPNDSGATISVYGAAGTGSPTLLAAATSAASGAFTTAYESSQQLYVGNTYYYFQVNRPLYLPTTPMTATVWSNTGQLISRPLTALNTVVLLGGDATDDNKIDISDASCIGLQYGSMTPGFCNGGTTGWADVNGDGKVDLFDLVLMGGNFDKNSSLWIQN